MQTTRDHQHHSDLPILSCFPCLAFPMDSTIQALGPAFSSPPSASWENLVLFHVVLHGMARPLFLENVSNKNHLSKALASLCHHSVTPVNQNLVGTIGTSRESLIRNWEFSRWKGIREVEWACVWPTELVYGEMGPLWCSLMYIFSSLKAIC